MTSRGVGCGIGSYAQQLSDLYSLSLLLNRVNDILYPTTAWGGGDRSLSPLLFRYRLPSDAIQRTLIIAEVHLESHTAPL